MSTDLTLPAAGRVINPTSCSITITDVTDDALRATLLSYTSAVGAQPSRVILSLPYALLSDVTNSALRGKAVTVNVNSLQVLVGNIVKITKSLSDQKVVLNCVDYRWRMNKTFVGSKHLETLETTSSSASYGVPTTYDKGIPWMGADIIFNEGGKPTKKKGTGGTSTTVPAFIYADTGNDCGTENREFWTYKDIIWWLWDKYVDTDLVAMPDWPADLGGLDKSSEEINLFNVPVCEAIGQVFGRTNCSWSLGYDGKAYIFSKASPRTTFTLKFGDMSSPSAASDYTLAYPEDITVEESIETTVNKLYVIGGKQAREVCLKGNADWTYTGSGVYSIEPLQGWKQLWVGPFLNYSNYAIDGTVWGMFRNRYVINKARYQTHNAGYNLPGLSKAKPFRNDLLIKRKLDGTYTDPLDDCGIAPVGNQELLYSQYPDGFTINQDYGIIDTRGKTSWSDLPGWYSTLKPDKHAAESPLHFTCTIDTEIRAYQTTETSLRGMPDTVERAIIRDTLVHSTREETKAGWPVDCVTSGLPLAAWTISPAFAVSSVTGATKDWDTEEVQPLDTTRLTATLPAAVVIDAMTPLKDLAGIASSEVGKVVVTVHGKFPSWLPLELGTKLGGLADFGDADVFVTGVVFDGITQSLTFQAASILNKNAEQLAQAFVNQQNYRIRFK